MFILSTTHRAAQRIAISSIEHVRNHGDETTLIDASFTLPSSSDSLLCLRSLSPQCNFVQAASKNADRELFADIKISTLVQEVHHFKSCDDRHLDSVRGSTWKFSHDHARLTALQFRSRENSEPKVKLPLPRCPGRCTY
jgi:hypothetical protein